MNGDAESSLIIARLLLRKGDPREARTHAQTALFLFPLETQPEQWLEAARIFFQCCQELEELSTADKYMDQTCELLRKGSSDEVQAKAETLLSSWLLAQGKRAEAIGYAQSAIHKATLNQDLSTLARSLVILSLALCQDEKTYPQAFLQLDKLSLISKSIENPETLITAQVLRGFILTQTKQYDDSLATLWKAYEVAKENGFQLIVSSIVAQIARVYRDQNLMDQYKLYSELALKGTSQERTPRLYKQIKNLCPEDIQQNRLSFDVQIEENTRTVIERHKGPIDFKNQHILYDLAILFFKNAGHRFSKEDLVKHIWHQKYDSNLHDNLIYVSIKRLRTLLEPDLESPKYILRDRKGYYYNPNCTIQYKISDEVTL